MSKGIGHKSVSSNIIPTCSTTIPYQYREREERGRGRERRGKEGEREREGEGGRERERERGRQIASKGITLYSVHIYMCKGGL